MAVDLKNLDKMTTSFTFINGAGSVFFFFCTDDETFIELWVSNFSFFVCQIIMSSVSWFIHDGNLKKKTFLKCSTEIFCKSSAATLPFERYWAIPWFVFDSFSRTLCCVWAVSCDQVAIFCISRKIDIHTKGIEHLSIF